MKIKKEKISFLSDKQKILGTLIRPAVIKSKIPAIIFFHGMTSSEKGYVPIAEKIAKHGICAMTLSIRGHGNSAGNFNKLTANDGVRDGLNAYDYLARYSFVDSSKIGLCGSSVGGVIASLVSKQRKVKSLVLKAPAIYTKEMMDNMTYSQSMSREDKIFKEIEDEKNTPAIKAITQFKGSMLLIISEKDGILPREKQLQYFYKATKTKIKNKVIIKGADHSLSKQKWKKEFINEMQKWFISTL